MSRSRRKLPICSVTTAASDKPFKAASHRAERAAVRSALVHGSELPHRLAYGDPWDAPKDGKLWHGQRWLEVYRK